MWILLPLFFKKEKKSLCVYMIVYTQKKKRPKGQSQTTNGGCPQETGLRMREGVDFLYFCNA